MRKGFMKAGHLPTLFAAFLYFDMSFMVWVMLGPMGVQIAKDLSLSPAEKGLMVATPVLAGALLRLPAGVLVDHLKPRLTGALMQVLVIAGLLFAWLFGVQSFSQVLLVGCVLGVAGASFAVALPLASRWYPPEHQGTALGIAGAGNSGTVFAALFAPALAAMVRLVERVRAGGHPARPHARGLPRSRQGQRRVSAAASRCATTSAC